MTALTSDELEAVAERMLGNGVDVAGALTATVITGGRSNLTLGLTDGCSRWVLRTPPRTGRTPSAHDVAREFRVTAALATTDVPVARPVLLCEDASVIGGPFVVAEHVTGVTLQTRSDLAAVSDSTLDALVRRLVEALACLHRVDHEGVGLARPGRTGLYAERQLKRWSGQWDVVGSSRLGPLAHELGSRLAGGLPEQRATSIVHGDFRVDNTLLDLTEHPRVLAVIDWELSTIGDPVADVAMMCAYRHSAFDLIVGGPSAWTSPRLPDPSALADLYVSAGGAELVQWDFHLALAYFKIAVIAAGIDYRYRAGSGTGSGFDSAGESVEQFFAAGLASLGATA